MRLFDIALHVFRLLDWLQARQEKMIVMTAQTSLLLCLPSQWRNGLSRVLRLIATCQSLLVSLWTKH